MNIVEDVRKTVSNPKPLYFAAGLGDAAVSALKDAPALLNDVSARAGEVAAKVAETVAGAAETVQSRVTLGQWDPKTLRAKVAEPDLRAVREKAQTLALVQVGRVLEVAGKAIETYDGYSERGKTVVERVISGRSGTQVEVVDVAEAAGAETVVVEETVVEAAPTAEAKSEAKAEAPEAKADETAAPAAAKANGTATAPKPAATSRKTAAPRRKPTTPKA